MGTGQQVAGKWERGNTQAENQGKQGKATWSVGHLIKQSCKAGKLPAAGRLAAPAADLECAIDTKKVQAKV